MYARKLFGTALTLALLAAAVPVRAVPVDWPVVRAGRTVHTGVDWQDGEAYVQPAAAAAALGLTWTDQIPLDYWSNPQQVGGGTGPAFQLDQQLLQAPGTHTAVLAQSGQHLALLVRGDRRSLLALVHGTTFAPVWVQPLEGVTNFTPAAPVLAAAAGNGLYVLAGGELHRYSLTDGHLLASVPAGADTLAASEHAVVLEQGGRLTAYDPEKLEQVWNLAGPDLCGWTLDGDQLVAGLPRDGGRVGWTAFRLPAGAVLWNSDAAWAADCAGPAPVRAGGHWVVAGGARLGALDARGQVRWERELPHRADTLHGHLGGAVVTWTVPDAHPGRQAQRLDAATGAENWAAAVPATGRPAAVGPYLLVPGPGRPYGLHLAGGTAFQLPPALWETGAGRLAHVNDALVLAGARLRRLVPATPGPDSEQIRLDGLLAGRATVAGNETLVPLLALGRAAGYAAALEGGRIDLLGDAGVRWEPLAAPEVPAFVQGGPVGKAVAGISGRIPALGAPAGDWLVLAGSGPLKVAFGHWEPTASGRRWAEDYAARARGTRLAAAYWLRTGGPLGPGDLAVLSEAPAGTLYLDVFALAGGRLQAVWQDQVPAGSRLFQDLGQFRYHVATPQDGGRYRLQPHARTADTYVAVGPARTTLHAYPLTAAPGVPGWGALFREGAWAPATAELAAGDPARALLLHPDSDGAWAALGH